MKEVKRIISCAITGSVHTPTMSPYLPLAPRQIAEEAERACSAGAATVHIHVRDPETGVPSSSLDLFRETVTEIKQRCDVIIGITSGGNYRQSDEERIRAVRELKPELASLDVGSMNYGVFPLAEKYRNWKFDWEHPYLAGTKNGVFINSFQSLEHFAKTMGKVGTIPEIEIFDSSWVQNAAYLARNGFLTRKPLWVQFVMGVLGGAPCSVPTLVSLHQTARDLLEDFCWSLSAADRHPFAFFAAALAMGGHVRVGMEDSLYTSRGKLSQSNAEQVEKAARLVREVGFEIASPDEARLLIGTKGKNQVGF
jgi:uncharacterized protein (DUF849 family)